MGRRTREAMSDTRKSPDRHTTMREPVAAAGSPFAFAFVGDALALDLINTDVVIRRRPLDLLAAPGAYAAWWHAAAERYPEVVGRLPATDAAANPDLLPAVLELRGALRAIFGAVAVGRTPPNADLSV